MNEKTIKTFGELATIFTIIAGVVTVVSYLESQKLKKLQEENAKLESELRKLQLEQTKKGANLI